MPVYKIEGTLHRKEDEKVFDSGFKIREFVLITEENYPQTIKMQLMKDNTDLLDKYEDGSRIEVSFAVNGREVDKEGKLYVFNNLVALGLKPLGVTTPVEVTPEAVNAIADSPDDLPF